MMTARRIFVTQLKEGSFPGEVVRGAVLADSSTAEIYLVVRGHGLAGLADPGILGAQTSTFMGGWESHECGDVQFVVIGQAMESADDD
jgi:hypothetical protein